MFTDDLPSKYTLIWQHFGDHLRGFFEEMGRSLHADGPVNLHALLQSLYGIPYREVRRALQAPSVDDTSENIGPVTGLFFEQVVVAMLVPYIRRTLPNARFERNKCSSSRTRTLARDPDLFVVSGKHEVVFEIKASPKKRDLEYILELRGRYCAAGVGYFLVGGYVAANPSLLKLFANDAWACFTESSTANAVVLAELPSLDQVLANALKQLAAA